jgi:hypothetical protein
MLLTESPRQLLLKWFNYHVVRALQDPLLREALSSGMLSAPSGSQRTFSLPRVSNV